MDNIRTLVILGASGDLTRRLLLPGLGTLLREEPERRVRVVGADRVELEFDTPSDADVFQAGLYGVTQLGPVKLGAAGVSTGASLTEETVIEAVSVALLNAVVPP